MRVSVNLAVLAGILGSSAATLRGYGDSLVRPEATCSYSATCTVGSVEGVCVSVSAGCCSGTVTSNLCPGSSDIKCCTNNACSTEYGEGSCMQGSLCKTYADSTPIPGSCLGPSDLQCCVAGTGSELGVDISVLVEKSSFDCLVSSGYKFVVPRAYRSLGVVDTNACTNLNNAKAAGIAKRDVYLFPCPQCTTTPAQQMDEMVTHLRSNCPDAWSGRVWLDIEEPQYWLSSYSANQEWFKGLVDSCKTSGVECGVYSFKSHWTELFGSSDFSYGADELLLWYAHYDNNLSFSDYVSFGGWKTPHGKQTAGNALVCDIAGQLDTDWAVEW